MKNMIIAATNAVTSLVAFNAPSQAAPFSGTLAQNATSDVQNVDYRPGYRHHNRKWNRNCFVRTERHRVHGRIIIKKVRVCR